jgi:hypothetical protein
MGAIGGRVVHPAEEGLGIEEEADERDDPEPPGSHRTVEGPHVRMGQLPPQKIPVSIQDEMRTSYLDYAMSVIIGRAIPDVRDGLKPVHRRILYSDVRAGPRCPTG